MNVKYPGLSQRLTKLFTNKKVQPCVIDGELIPYDQSKREILPFSILQKMPRKIIEPEQEEEISIKIVAFDCLSIGEDDLINHPIEHRKNKLQEIVNKTKDVTSDLIEINSELLDLEKEESLQQLVGLLKNSKKEGFEGLVVKPTGPGTLYISRSRSQWIKIKALANEGEMALDTLDLVIMGAYKGSVNYFD